MQPPTTQAQRVLPDGHSLRDTWMAMCPYGSNGRPQGLAAAHGQRLRSLRVAGRAAEDGGTCLREYKPIAERIDKHHVQSAPGLCYDS
jgi:hypothetical protein